MSVGGSDGERLAASPEIETNEIIATGYGHKLHLRNNSEDYQCSHLKTIVSCLKGTVSRKSV
jgi:hypothetical protein